jgi:hypothetical protein
MSWKRKNLSIVGGWVCWIDDGEGFLRPPGSLFAFEGARGGHDIEPVLSLRERPSTGGVAFTAVEAIASAAILSLNHSSAAARASGEGSHRGVGLGQPV